MRNKHSMGRRFLALLLCALMMVGLMPTTALAATTTTVSNATELQNAIKNAGNGDTIKLGADITFNNSSQIKTVPDVYQDKQALTYDLTLTSTVERRPTLAGIPLGSWEYLTNGGKYTEFRLPSELQKEDTRSLLKMRNGQVVDSYGSVTYVREHGDATTYLLIDGKNLTIDLNGKTINATHNDAYFSALFVTGNSTVTIKGNGGITSGQTAITASGSGATVNIQGGSFTGYTAVAALNYGRVNITGGAFTGRNVTQRVITTAVNFTTKSEYIREDSAGDEFGYEQIREENTYEGTASRTVNCATLYTENYGYIGVSGAPTVEAPPGGTLFYNNRPIQQESAGGTFISGGTFEGNMTAQSASATGGTFSENPQNVVTGLSFTPSADCKVEATTGGGYGVITQEEWNSRGYVAAIGDVGYYSLEAAVNNVENGKTIRLLKDINASVTLTKAKTYTLNLDDHTINNYVTVKAGNVTIRYGTINYDGTGNALKTEGDSAVLTANCTVNAPSGVALSAGYGSTNGGTVNVTGGEYTGRLGTAAGGTLSITGGKFKNDPSAYVAEGLVAKKGADGWYTVQVGTAVIGMEIWNKEDLLAFKAEVEKGADTDIDGILMANINLSGTTWDPIGLNPSVAYRGTFDGNGYSIQNLNSSTGGLFHKISSEGTVCNLRIASGTISGTGDLGAIVNDSEGEVINCSNAATVTGTGTSGTVGGIAGGIRGSADQCYNSGKITGAYRVAGVGRWCTNCYNTGEIVNTDSSVTGVAAGVGYGGAKNSYNTGTITATNLAADKVYNVGMNPEDDFYQTQQGSATDGTQKTAAQFASGEVTWLLNNESADGPWYQNLSGSGRTADPYPVLDPTHLRVYKTSSGQYTNITYYSVRNPNDLSVSYGTSARILAQLPATVEVRGVAGNKYRSYYYDVEWDMDSSGFDPQSLESQTITIPGKVNVTDMTNGGVKNVSIQVTVAAPGISKLELDAAPSLTYEAGASLNFSGTRVSAIYVNDVVVNLTDATEGVTFTYADGTTLSKATHDGKTLSLTYKGKTVQLGTLDVLSTDNTIQTLKVHGETAAYADGAYTVTLPPDKTLPSSESDISVTLRDKSATVVSKVQGDSAAVWQITVKAENGVEAVYPLHIDIAPPYANQNEAAIAEITSKWNALTKSWTAAQADIQRDDMPKPGGDGNLSHAEILRHWLLAQLSTALAIPKELEDYISIDVTLDDPVSWAIAGARADHDGTDGNFGFTVTVTASKGNADDHKTATLTGGSGTITATPYAAPDYTVHFNSGGGSSVADLVVKEDDVIGENAPADPTFEHYTFLGWFTQPTGGEKWDMANDKVDRDNITLYAQWELTKYKVVLPENQHGYTLTADKTEVVWNESVTFTYKLGVGYNGDDLVIKVNGTQVTPDGNGQFTVGGNVDSNIVVTVDGVINAPTYTVTIPESVNLDSTATVSAAGVNVAEGSSLYVAIGGEFTIANSNPLFKQTIGYPVHLDSKKGTQIQPGDTVLTVAGGVANNNGRQVLYFGLPTEEPKYADDYKGTVTFRIGIKDTE